MPIRHVTHSAVNMHMYCLKDIQSPAILSICYALIADMSPWLCLCVCVKRVTQNPSLRWSLWFWWRALVGIQTSALCSLCQHCQWNMATADVANDSEREGAMVAKSFTTAKQQLSLWCLEACYYLLLNFAHEETATTKVKNTCKTLILPMKKLFKEPPVKLQYLNNICKNLTYTWIHLPSLSE